MTNHEKSKNRELKNTYKQQEKERFLSDLPMPIKEFSDLFDDLDVQLDEFPCNHTLKHTENFLRKQHLPVEPVIAWLNNNGGYCDCEVLGNVEEKFEGF